ncbi:MAG: sodium:calcium antiporter [Gammaproteobacteria bacterium]|jgi:cation:H+ antiporter|nr:sodium:calcium antiporter [Gammaproteobacteria bacterium]
MFEAIGFTVLGLVFLALGGDSLVKGAAGLSAVLRIPRFAVGLGLVAVATSLPELAVNARAVFAGDRALALGNAVGSNIANVGLTLGAAALAAPVVVRWRALAPLLALLLLATLAVAAMGLDGALSRVEGAILLLFFIGVVAFAASRARHESPDVRAAVDAFVPTRGDMALNLVRLAIAVVLLWFGAGWVVAHIPAIGRALGMDSLVAGLVLVAIATALPEAAAAVAAARRGQGDLVAGHVVGSSLFNVLVVLGGMAAIGGSVPVPASFVRLELPVAFLFALLLLPLLRGNTTVSRLEGGLLVAALAGWVVLEFALLA